VQWVLYGGFVGVGVGFGFVEVLGHRLYNSALW